MANPHPTALRERAVQAYESGRGTYDEVAQQFSIARRTLQRWTTRKRDTGDVQPEVKGGGNPSPVEFAVLERVMAAHPDAVTNELTVAYNNIVGRKKRVHRSSILRALRRRGYVFKKNGRGLQSKTASTSKRSDDDS